MKSPASENRIYFPTHEYAPFRGGIAIYVEELAGACAAAGARPVVLAPAYGGLTSQSGPISTVRVSMRGKQDWICRWRMGTALKREVSRRGHRGTVVLAEPGPIRWWMHPMLTRPPTVDRLVIILHGSELKQLSANPIRRRLLGSLLSKAYCVGVVSTPVRDMAAEIYPQITDRLKLVPGAIRASMESARVPEWDTRREEILHVGRIHPRKGQLELVEACGRLPADLRNRFLVRLVGPPARPSYARQVREAAERFSVRIEMPGELADSSLIESYQRARLFVMPSRDFKSSVEGLGLVLLEAQYLECPVIATDVGGVRDAVDPGRTGLLVPPADVTQLAHAIQHLLQDDTRSAEFGQQGRLFVQQSFSWRANSGSLGLI